jgi:hypothetical protein
MVGYIRYEDNYVYKNVRNWCDFSVMSGASAELGQAG